jgi:lipoprotein signal peptidase
VSIRGRIALVVVGAVALAAVDLAVKAALMTSPWLLHERSRAWLALSLLLVAGCLVLARIPSRTVTGAAGLTAGGLLGNIASALTHDGAVPDPLLLGGAQHGVAFNMADVFFVLGVLGLVSAAIRHRRLIVPQ